MLGLPGAPGYYVKTTIFMNSNSENNNTDKIKPRAAIHALGCRLNQAEAATLQSSLEQAGYQMVPWGEEAEVCVLNSCTVTGQSDAKSRQALGAIRRQYPQAKLAVVGCYAQMAGDTLAQKDLADLIIGSQEKMNLVQHLQAPQADNAAPQVIRPPIRREAFSQQAWAAQDAATRPHLKVQDGCDFMCSFCVIPFARGRSRPRLLADTLAEAGHLATQGAKELVLTGVNVGTWAENGQNLLAMVDALNDLPGLARIRIGSIEPTTVPPGLLERMAAADHKLVPFLHLPLQSGSNTVLSAMRRRYTAQQYRAEVMSAVSQVPDVCVGADVLTGFPGEDDALHQETLDFLAELPLAYFHVFPYSPRQGTPAARMGDQVPAPVKRQRVQQLMALSDSKRLAYQAGFVGRVLPVLFERAAPGSPAQGYTANYLRVGLSPEAPAPEPNSLHPVRMTATGLPLMQGQALPGGFSSQ